MKTFILPALALVLFAASCSKSKNDNSTPSQKLFSKYLPGIDTAMFYNINGSYDNTNDTIRFSSNGSFSLRSATSSGEVTTTNYVFTIDSTDGNLIYGTVTEPDDYTIKASAAIRQPLGGTTVYDFQIKTQEQQLHSDYYVGQ